MQVKTWLQRLTDESNLWFGAVKAEDEGNFLEAASNYVEDATRCLEQNLVRSALSCSCAAHCLMHLGAKSRAQTLYSTAAKIYMDNSDLALSGSIREALWSMQEALENFALAGNYKEAVQIRNKYLALSSRINPFGRPTIALPAFEKNATPADPATKETDIPRDLANRIYNFIELYRKSSVRHDTFDPGDVLRSINSTGGSKLNEKSIAS
jgi:tetratricopeptide (TPR) repeat protein